jgi:beta-lactam-binding protein with PASTA domain
VLSESGLVLGQSIAPNTPVAPGTAVNVSLGQFVQNHQ